MKTFATTCLLGVLVAAFAVVAVITWDGARAGAAPGEPALDRRALGGDTGLTGPREAVVRDLLAGRDVECDRIVRLLLGIDESEDLDHQRLGRLLLGIDESEDLDTNEVLALLDRLAAADSAGR